MKVSICFFLSFLFFLSAIAGKNQWEAEVQPPQKDGFVKIELPPAVTGNSTNNFKDLRLYNQKGEEVPYLLQKEQAVAKKRVFHEYEIKDVAYEKDSFTHVLIHNPKKEEINKISLEIKNSAVRKSIQLSGSNGLKQWFVVKDYHSIHSVNNKKGTSTIKVVDFPLTDYKYYKIEFNDRQSPPVNVIRAGYYQTITDSGKYTFVPGISFEQKDSSDQKSYIRIRFDSTQFVERFQFSFSDNVPFYKRNARITVRKTPQPKRWKKNHTPYYQTKASFVLRSDEPNEIVLQGAHFKEIRLIIDNKDNPPLSLQSVRASYHNRYLCAFLKKGEKYHLQFGDKEARKPVYDLAYFEDSIPENPPVTGVINIRKTDQKTFAAGTFFSNKAWIWGAIVLVLIILSVMTIRMVKEMHKNN